MRHFGFASGFGAFWGFCLWQLPAYAFDLTIVTQAAPAAVFQLVSATPYDRQVVTPAPAQYVLRFSQPVRPDRSSIKLLDMYGHKVRTDALLSDGLAIAMNLPALVAGRYTVKWQATCQCAEQNTLGETFHFTIK